MQSHTVDSFSEVNCTQTLNYTVESMNKNMEYFSRSLDPLYFDHAIKIYEHLKSLGNKTDLAVFTWELYDKAFAFPRVRRYEIVQQNMDMLEHFQDNLNMNITNKQSFSNFLRVA